MPSKSSPEIWAHWRPMIQWSTLWFQWTFNIFGQTSIDHENLASSTKCTPYVLFASLVVVSSPMSLLQGYDWNQYNKKHYDTDNPPPKTVQGYKFNVRSLSLRNEWELNVTFLDLLSRSDRQEQNSVVQFGENSPFLRSSPCCVSLLCRLSVKTIENSPFSNFMLVLRMRSVQLTVWHWWSLPTVLSIQDIAFKIVSKEWDYSYKHGFRCHFQNGIFQLWFHFRKWKYRRWTLFYLFWTVLVLVSQCCSSLSDPLPSLRRSQWSVFLVSSLVWPSSSGVNTSSPTSSLSMNACVVPIHSSVWWEINWLCLSLSSRDARRN